MKGVPVMASLWFCWSGSGWMGMRSLLGGRLGVETAVPRGTGGGHSELKGDWVSEASRCPLN